MLGHGLQPGQLAASHYPSNVDELMRSLRRLDSLSQIPDGLVLDDDLHL